MQKVSTRTVHSPVKHCCEDKFVYDDTISVRKTLVLEYDDTISVRKTLVLENIFPNFSKKCFPIVLKYCR